MTNSERESNEDSSRNRARLCLACRAEVYLKFDVGENQENVE